MRARVVFSLCSLASLGLVAVFGVATGCGGTADDAPATAVDSGADVAKDATGDAQPFDSGPQDCVDADITKLPLPDADVGDSGVNIGECASCLKANCSGDLEICQEDCPCRESVVKFFNCVGGGKPLTTCAGSLASAGSSAQSLGLCALNSGCAAKCGVSIDAGKNDAATDAPVDAPVAD